MSVLGKVVSDVLGLESSIIDDLSDGVEQNDVAEVDVPTTDVLADLALEAHVADARVLLDRVVRPQSPKRLDLQLDRPRIRVHSESRVVDQTAPEAISA